MTRAHAAVALMLALAGCDMEYGALREAAIPRAPDPGCVESVIRKAPGVERLRQGRASRGRAYGLWHSVPRSEVHYFYYDGPKVRGIVQVTVRTDGSARYADYILALNESPPPEFIDGTRLAMRWIDGHVEAECRMTGLTQAAPEQCLRIECRPLGD